MNHLLTLTTALLVSLSAVAADYTPLQMGEVFTIADNGTEIWAITPQVTGTMRIVGDNGDGDYIGSCLVVYDSEAMTKEVQRYNWTYYEVPVRAGQTYYIKTWNYTGQNYRGHCEMGGDFKFVGAEPAVGDVFPIVGDCEVYLHFSSPSLSFKNGTLSVADETIPIYFYNDFNQLVSDGTFTYTEQGTSGMVNYNGAVLGHLDNDGIVIPFITQTGTDHINLLFTLLEQGKIHTGDLMTLTLNGIQNTLTGQTLPPLKLTWTVGDMPTTLTSATLPDNFLSYWLSDDDEGIATWTFSRDIQSAQLSLGMGYADLDDRYEGELPLTIRGNQVIADLRGVLRTASTMHLTTTYPQMEVTLYDVVDANGNHTYADGQGRVASYSYALNYIDLTTVISYEVSPSDATRLDTTTASEIELWYESNDIIECDAVSVSYTLEGNSTHYTLPFSDSSTPHATAITDNYGTTITLPITDAMRHADDVFIVLNITKSRDGLPHYIGAIYNPTQATLDAITHPTANSKSVRPYNLNGQAVMRPTRGILILNGTKIAQ